MYSSIISNSSSLHVFRALHPTYGRRFLSAPTFLARPAAPFAGRSTKAAALVTLSPAAAEFLPEGAGRVGGPFGSVLPVLRRCAALGMECQGLRRAAICGQLSEISLPRAPGAMRAPGQDAACWGLARAQHHVEVLCQEGAGLPAKAKDRDPRNEFLISASETTAPGYPSANGGNVNSWTGAELKQYHAMH